MSSRRSAPSQPEVPPGGRLAADVKAIRPQWLTELSPLLRRGDSGQALSAALSRHWDQLIGEHVGASLGDQVARCGVYALGGYGREEMAPYSDIDLMVLLPSEKDAALLGRVEHLIESLWGAGIKLGHSVRTPEQCLELAREDTTIATSLLDARRLAGSPDLVPDLVDRIADGIRQDGLDAFLRLLRQGVRERGHKYGDSAYLLEPQVKQGRGGLRDLHAIDWAARLTFGTSDLAALVERGHVSEDEARRIDAARSFLLRTRFALHLHHGWKQDQLTYAAQGPVAALMGFGEEHIDESLGRFMKAYYLHARTIASVTELWLQEWGLDQGDGDLAVEWLTLDRAGGALTDEPGAVFDLLRRAQSERLRPHPAVLRALAGSGPGMPTGVAQDKQAAAVVRAIICDLDDPNDLLQTIADAGILAAVIPEWAHLTGLAQHDTYHVYTIDVHLLVTCRRMKQLLRGEVAVRSPYLSGVAHRYCNREHPDALVLATLVHDIGKGLGGDHSIIGAGLGTEIARRLGFEGREQTLVRSLIREHLTMPKVSQRRDLRDPATLRAFVRRVPSPRLLDGLALLSFVDMDSVGPGHLTDWKLHLLEQLHRAATAFLQQRDTGGRRARSEPLDLLRELLEHELSSEELDWLTNHLPRRLIETCPVPQLVRCARLVAQRPAAAAVRFHDAKDASFTEVLVFEPTYPGRLAEVAGVLDAAGLDIRQAASHPLDPGGTLDVLEVRTAGPDHEAIPQRKKDAIAADIGDVLSGARRTEEILHRKLEQSRLPPRKRPYVATSVLVDNDWDPAFTILEVKAPDAPGLLARLARSLAELDLQVDRSIITTEGDRAIDTFYVVDARGTKLDEPSAAVARQAILDALRAGSGPRSKSSPQAP